MDKEVEVYKGLLPKTADVGELLNGADCVMLAWGP